MHIAWLQLGSTTLLFISMQMPHSSSLSMSISETGLLPSSSSLLRYLSVQTAFCLRSSTSLIPLGSCIREGNITAATSNNAHQYHKTKLQTGIFSPNCCRTLAIKFPHACFPLMRGHGGTPIHINLHADQSCLSTAAKVRHQILLNTAPHHMNWSRNRKPPCRLGS